MFDRENKVHLGIEHSCWVGDWFGDDFSCTLVVTDLVDREGDIFFDAFRG